MVLISWYLALQLRYFVSDRRSLKKLGPLFK